MPNTPQSKRLFSSYFIRIFLLLLLGFALSMTACDIMNATEPLPDEDTLQSIQEITLASSQGAAITPDFSEGVFCIEGKQSSGALYEICLPPPEIFNGNMIVYARGFVFPQNALSVPDDQLGGQPAKEIITAQGNVYAATSFYSTGLLDPAKGLKDLRELITLYTRHFGRTYGTLDDVFLVGFSNGAMLSTLAIEKSAGLYSGALASCGPIDSYRRQIDYFGDVFVLFNHFIGTTLLDLPVYPLALPRSCLEGSPEGFSPSCVQGIMEAAATTQGGLDAFLIGQIGAALTANPAGAALLYETLRLTPNINARFTTQEELLQTVAGVLAYVWFSTNDAVTKLGGRPYDNTERQYVSSDPDLNDDIARYEADRRAVAQLEARYETKGHLRESVVTLHNTVDPIVPIWQAEDFEEKIRKGEEFFSLNPFSAPKERFGHCDFTLNELQQALGLLDPSAQLATAMH